MSRGVARPPLFYYVPAECSGSEVGHATRDPYHFRGTTSRRTKCSIVFHTQHARDKVKSYIPRTGPAGRRASLRV
jgi:hypothetical protein